MSAQATDPPDLVAVGRILKPHGVRGEIRVQILTDFPERFEESRELWLVPPAGQAQLRKVEGARFHSGWVLLKIEGIADPEAVAEFRNWFVSVPRDDLFELDEDEYWHFELEGLEVRDESGAVLGRLKEVLATPGHDLYVVDGARGEILIPAVGEFVLSVDVEAGFMVVRPPVLED